MRYEIPAFNTMADKELIDHIVLRGDAFNRGHSYGEQCGQRIAKNLEFYKNRYNCLNWETVYQYIDNNYVKAIRKYYPLALKEMEGMAEGAGIPLMDIVFINARY